MGSRVTVKKYSTYAVREVINKHGGITAVLEMKPKDQRKLIKMEFPLEKACKCSKEQCRCSPEEMVRGVRYRRTIWGKEFRKALGHEHTHCAVAASDIC